MDEQMNNNGVMVGWWQGRWQLTPTLNCWLSKNCWQIFVSSKNFRPKTQNFGLKPGILKKC